jgi:hypothetical protein
VRGVKRDQHRHRFTINQICIAPHPTPPPFFLL